MKGGTFDTHNEYLAGQGRTAEDGSHTAPKAITYIKCPLCKGEGWVSLSDDLTETQECPRCLGEGYVSVEEEE